MIKKYEIFANELARSNINPELAKTLAHTNFECIISGPSLLNYNVQSNFASIYRVLFYYFAPLRVEEVHKDVKHLQYTLTNFTPDQQWEKSYLTQMQEEVQELTKRTNNQQQKKYKPPNRQINQDLKEQLRKFAIKNQNKVSEREITKQILKYLQSLPQIRLLEEKEGIEQSPSSKLIYKIEQVKASMKRKNQPMNTILENVLSMFENYYRKQQLTRQELEDHTQMIRRFFDDGKSVLESYSPSIVNKKIQKMVIKSTIVEQAKDFQEKIEESD